MEGSWIKVISSSQPNFLLLVQFVFNQHIYIHASVHIGPINWWGRFCIWRDHKGNWNTKQWMEKMNMQMKS